MGVAIYLVDETLKSAVYGRAGFSVKNFFAPKLGKYIKNGPKTFFEFIEKFGHYFLLNLFYNEYLQSKSVK